jgi:hypothetical protein
MANASVKEAKGNVLFVDDDKSYTLSLKPQVRFVDASEYTVKGKDSFYGFLAGILAGNYDISVIYVDAFLKLVKTDVADLVDFEQNAVQVTIKIDFFDFLNVAAFFAFTPQFLTAA